MVVVAARNERLFEFCLVPCKLNESKGGSKKAQGIAEMPHL